MDEAKREEHKAAVLVIGAGMAGLTAARALLQSGLRVVVLEARDHVGGRILSSPTPGGGVAELGAEFVHGRVPELWSLLEEAGLQTTERDGAMLRETYAGHLQQDDSERGEIFAALEDLEHFRGKDVPFAEWLAGSGVAEQEKDALVGFVEGFNAADAGRIGVHALGVQQKAEDAVEGGRAWHVRGGYAQIADFLADKVEALGGEVRLGCCVKTIRWSSGCVEVETSLGIFRAPRCLVTLPLGVLQRVNTEGGIIIAPEPAAINAARQLEMGHAVRFTMVFRERWWEHPSSLSHNQLETMSFLFTPSRMPPVWWTSHPEEEAQPTLTGWVGGPRASALAGKSSGVLAQAACAALAAVFGVEESQVRAALLETHTHDWSADPFSLGAYSYVPAGALDAPAAMTLPEADTLFFAGEHTDITGHWGTVHAAIRSGLRAAEQVAARCTPPSPDT